MNITAATCDLQQCLLEQSLIEATAAIFARRLSQSTLLTSEERDFAADRLCPEEASHMRWCRAAAKHLGRIDGFSIAEQLGDDLEIQKTRLHGDVRQSEDLSYLVRLSFDERFFLRFSDYYIDVISRLLPDEIAQGATQMLDEERCHKEWGSRIRRRLRTDYPEWMSELRRYETVRNQPVHALARRLGNVHRALAFL